MSDKKEITPEKVATAWDYKQDKYWQDFFDKMNVRNERNFDFYGHPYTEKDWGFNIESTKWMCYIPENRRYLKANSFIKIEDWLEFIKDYGELVDDYEVVEGKW